jgi:hypothetical protein
MTTVKNIDVATPQQGELRSRTTRSLVMGWTTRISPHLAFGLTLFFIVGLAAFTASSSVRANTTVLSSFWAASGALFVWSALLFGSAARERTVFILEVVLRRQHYLQACVQTTLILYWGWYWPEVYQSAHLIAAQLVFAYAFEMLLNWTRRRTHTLGFAPFPIVLSTNLFLWFKEDWFYLQFLMIAVAFAAKELIRWNKEGRRAHIFNPSAFGLSIFSLGLILTGAHDVTWGPSIAVTQFYPPHMYLLIFLIGLPGQFFFGVTSMTMSAVLTTYLFGLLYFVATGTYYFLDSYIPISIFLGMHFIFTDPSTAPRSELGRIMFGVLYGLTSVALFGLLEWFRIPSFYDKLLQLPLLNLSIKLIDRVARSKTLKSIDPAALGRFMSPPRRNLAYMTVWTAVFLVMSAAQGVGDAHRGQWLPFWQRACTERGLSPDGSWSSACRHLTEMQATYCNAGSGWACNELGVLQADHGVASAQTTDSIQKGCKLGYTPACLNLTRVTTDPSRLTRGTPTVADYSIILRGSKGVIEDVTPSALYARACKQGWPGTCGQNSMAGSP